MADFTALKTAIQNAIKQNGNEEITGDILQGVLLSMVSTLGDSAINDLVTALANEVTARQNADGTLQQNITSEATTRGNADTTLQQNIDAEAQARQQAVSAEAQARSNADTALGGRIDGVIESINAINNAIENGYVYAGIATPSSTPTTGKVFYLALTAGTYTNYGNKVVTQGINILKYNGSAWSLDAFVGIDDTPTPSSNNLIKSSGVFNEIMTNGSAFDLSAYNNGTTYADLNAALTALNSLPAAYKKGGMSMKFLRTSDNKYIQARCIANEFTTDVTKWQGVDDENVESDSKDLVTAGAISKTYGKYIDSDEYLAVITDGNDEIIEEIHQDGVRENLIGFKAPFMEIFETKYKGANVTTTENPEWAAVILDEEDNIIEGIRKDGTRYPSDKAEISGEVLGKKVSILGDSISTFDLEGFKTDGYDQHYPANNVQYIGETYWYKFLKYMGYCLDKNVSFANSCVVNSVNTNPDFFSRTNKLNNPDIIIVEVGTNDSQNNVTIGSYDFDTPITDLSEATFGQAYLKGVKALRQNYPNAKIILLALMMKQDYFDVIKDIAEHYGIDCIDARSYNNYDTVHPTAYGMNELANILIDKYAENPINYVDVDMVEPVETKLLDISNFEKQGIVIRRGEGQNDYDHQIAESPTVWFEPSLNKLVMIYVGYQGTDESLRSEWIGRILWATSEDGKVWTKQGVFYEGTGINGDYDCHVTGPYVVIENGKYYLFHCGMSHIGHEQGTKRILLTTANSFNDILNHNYQKKGVIIQANPLFNWCGKQVWRPSFVKHNNMWYMFINATGNDNYERVGFAKSAKLDGPWTLNPESVTTFLTPEQIAERTVALAADPFVFKRGNYYYMCYYAAINNNGFHMFDEWAYCSVLDFPFNWHYGGQSCLSGYQAGTGDTYEDYYSAGKPFIQNILGDMYHYFTAIGQDGGDQNHFQIGLGIHKNPILLNLNV